MSIPTRFMRDIDVRDLEQWYVKGCVRALSALVTRPQDQDKFDSTYDDIPDDLVKIDKALLDLDAAITGLMHLRRKLEQRFHKLTTPSLNHETP